jgi:acyl-CoA oxidase
MFSGIPDYYNTALPTNTFEGENYLLTQQTAKYLLKQVNIVKSGNIAHLPKTTAYLAQLSEPSLFASQRWSVRTPQDLLRFDTALEVYAHRAARLVNELHQATQDGIAWEQLQIECSRVSRAHCQYIMMYCVVEGMNGAEVSQLSPATRLALERLMALYHLYTMERDMGDFTEDDFVSAQQANMVRAQVRSLLRLIRPDALGLAESFGWPDFLLNSALGSSDGRAYERMFEELLKEPLNNEEMQDGVIRSYQDYIRPLIRGELGTWVVPGSSNSDVKAKL